MHISWMINRSFFVVCFLLLTITTHLSAEPKPLTDISYRYQYYHAIYQLHEDYTHEEKHEWAIKVLNQRAIEDLKTTSISHSASIEKIEILSAYNQKSDGTRIDAPKTNYQVNTNSGRDKNSPVFSDRQSIKTVFPDVQVGDTLVFSYKIITTEPMFPGYFSASDNFYENIAYDDVNIKIITPLNIKAHYKSNKMTERISSVNNQKIYEWGFINKTPTQELRKDYSVWNEEEYPGFWFSTFESYQAIAEAYGKRALPKATPTDAVKKLADSIAGKEVDPKKQAQLFYEWVATNISYAGNCVGVGAVVPHDISFILDNKMGDCKDHATLLQALLTSKNIKSTQALINAGSIYQLGSIPMVSSVNHVINYLPEFDLFVDSTSRNTPFGMLPASIQGKPVLLVEDFKSGMRTPVEPIGNNKQVLNAKLTIAKDGSVKGSVDVMLQGEPAIDVRSSWRRISKDQEIDWLKKYFSSNGADGNASMKKDDPMPLMNTFHYTIEFNKQEFIQTESAAGLYIYPVAPSYYSISELTDIENINSGIPVEIACSNGISEENYTYIFPDNFKILDIPSDKKVEGSYITYNATYRLEKNTIHIARKLEDKTPGPTCKPDLIDNQREVLKKINRNLKSQIVYKPLLDE